MERTYFENEHYKDLDINNEMYTDLRFIDCLFEDCKFHTIALDNCEFIDCEFVNCNVVTLKANNTDVRNATVSKSNLIGINWSELLPSSYKYASPIYKMNDSFLKYNTFSQLNLSKIDFKENIFDECMFDECNLSDSKFNDSEFKNTTITNSNLERADFKDALGYYIDIKSNRLKKARFSFPEVSNLLDSLDITID